MTNMTTAVLFFWYATEDNFSLLRTLIFNEFY